MTDTTESTNLVSRLSSIRAERVAGQAMLNANTARASGIGPEQAASDMNLAARAGVTPDYVGRNREVYEAAVRHEQIRRNPKLASWMADDPANAAISLDRVPWLSKVGDSLSNAGLGLASGVPALWQGFFGTLEATTGAVEQGLRAVGFPETAWGSVSRFFGEARKDYQGLVDRLNADKRNEGTLGSYATQGLQSVAANVPGIIASVMTGNPAFSLGSAGVVAGGQSAGRGIDAGLSPARALLFGVGDAGIEVATERLPIVKLLGDLKVGSSLVKTLFHQVLSEVPSEMAATIGQNFNAYANLTPDAPFSDYLNALPEDLAGTVIATLTATGVQTSMATAADRIISRIDGFDRASAKADAVQAQVEALAALFQSPDGQSMMGRSPEKVREFANHADDNQTFHIAAKPMLELFQSLPEEAKVTLLKSLPGFDGQLQEASAAETDIIMRRGDYAALFASQPWSAPLTEHVRENASDLSAADVRKLVENPELLAEVLSEMDPSMDASRITRKLQSAVQNAGVSPAQAGPWSELMTAVISRQAALQGMAGRTGDIVNQMVRALTFRRQAKDYVQPERITQTVQNLRNIQSSLAPDANATAAPSGEGKSLLSFLAERGGIDIKNESTPGLLSEAKTWHQSQRKGTRRLVGGKNAVSLDEAARAAAEAGYIGTRDIAELQNAIQEELSGRKVFTEQRAFAAPLRDQIAAQRSQDEENFYQFMTQGLQLNDKEIRALTPDMLQKLIAEYERTGEPSGEGQTLNQYRNSNKEYDIYNKISSFSEQNGYEISAEFASTGSIYFDITAPDGKSYNGRISSHSNQAGGRANWDNYTFMLYPERGDGMGGGHTFKAVERFFVEKYGAQPYKKPKTSTKKERISRAVKEQLDFYAGIKQDPVIAASNALKYGFYENDIEKSALEEIASGNTLYQFDAESGGKTPYSEPTITVEGKERPTTNSKGQPIAATKEGLENFWKWFGDSKVVDADGKPLVVYHGTNKKFDGDSFNLDTKAGVEITPTLQPIFTSSDPKYASEYANAGGGHVFPVYARANKLFDGGSDLIVEGSPSTTWWFDKATPLGKQLYTDIGDNKIWSDGAGNEDSYFSSLVGGNYDTVESLEFKRWLKSNGYDGFTTFEGGAVNYGVFSPTQIKSVHNRGTFSPDDARILYQITPEQAKQTNVPVDMPTTPEFYDSVTNTPGAKVTEDGLLIDLVRFQKPEQEGATAVRTGVFYLPIGSKNARYYKNAGTASNQNTYGGTEKFSGETLIRRPLFVKGSTGGKAPETAFDKLNGKGSMKKMNSAVFDVVNQQHIFKNEPEVYVDLVKRLLEDYGADPMLAIEIIYNSRKGNQLSYALQENIIAHAVRAAGYDAVVGYSKGKNGNFISEVFDVREQTYPAYGMDSEVHQTFYQQHRGSINFDTALRKVVISLTSGANLSTLLHESGHYFSLLHRQTAEMARTALANGSVTDPESIAALEKVVKDWDTLKEALGATSDTLTVEQEEQIAKWFEQYLREGKAPKPELRGAFATFKSWMLQIYNTLKDGILGKSLNNEVRAVFDRWIATDEEIRQASQINLQIEKIAAQFDSLNTKPDAAIAGKVARLLTRAGNKAGDELLAEVVREEDRKQTQEWKDDYAKTLEEVTKTADESKVYASQDFILAGHRLDSKLVEAMVGKEIAKKLPAGLRGGSFNPDLIAGQFGFADGADMIRAIASNIPKNEFVRQETESLMNARYGNMLEDGRAAERAKVLVANDEVGQAIELLVNTSGQKAQTRRVVKLAARQRMAETRFADINPGKYESARDKALRAAYKASAKGDGGTAAQHLWKAMLNHELLMSANEALEFKAKKLNQWKRMTYRPTAKGDEKLAKSYDLDLLDVGRVLLGRAGLGIGIQGFDPRAELTARAGEDLERLTMAKAVTEMPQTGHKDMTVAQFKMFADGIDNIKKVSRDRRQIILDGKLVPIIDLQERATVEFADLADGKIPMNRREAHQSLGLKAKGWLLDTNTWLMRVEHWIRAIEGDDVNGPLHTVFRSIKNACNAYHEALVTTTEKMVEIVKPLDERMDSHSIDAYELGIGQKIMGMKELVGMLLHIGNDSNTEKLVGGYRSHGWTEDGLWKFVQRMVDSGRLTRTDMDAVQNIWDLMESLKPEAQAAHYQRYGYRFDEVTARPFTLNFDGEEVTFRGGYFPAIVDSKLVSDAAAREKIESVLDSTETILWPTTSKEFTKTRVENYQQPLKLDANLAMANIAKVLKFIHLENTVWQAARVFKGRHLQEVIARTNPYVVRKTIIPWLQRVARQGVNAPMDSTGITRLLENQRRYAGVSAMALNAVNTMQQYFDIPTTIHEVGAANFARASQIFLSNPRQSVAWVTEMSGEMRNRLIVFQEEMPSAVRQILNNDGSLRSFSDWAVHNGYILQRMAQTQIDTVTFMAAYDKAISQNMSEEDAVYYAERAIRLSQSSSRPEDISNIEAVKNPLARLCLMFYGWFNNKYNQQVYGIDRILRENGWKDATPKIASLLLLTTIIPYVMGQAVYDAFTGGLPDDEDKDGIVDDWFWWFTSTIFRGVGAEIPGVREFSTLIAEEFSQKPYNSGLLSSPVVTLATRAAHVPSDIYKNLTGQKRDESAELKDFLAVITMATGIPTGQLGRTVGYLVDIHEGDAKPEGIGDVAAGLVAGTPQKH